MDTLNKNGREIAGKDFEQITDGLFFIAASPAARKLRTQAVLLAQVDVPVLIAGEKGSGRGVAGHFIHKLSARSAGKFIRVGCVGTTRELLDVELFGSEYTGSDGAPVIHQGTIELCRQGTLLLDEIVELPMELQFKLLRLLQDKQFLRVGGEIPVQADVRILGTISIEINRVLREKKLHEDLYNRLSAFTLQVPSLRERTEEVALLMDYFMRETAKLYSLPPRSFSRTMLAACEEHGWPGNLRELRNYVKRYLVIGDEELAIAELRGGDIKDDFKAQVTLEAVATAPANTSGLKSLIRSTITA